MQQQGCSQEDDSVCSNSEYTDPNNTFPTTELAGVYKEGSRVESLVSALEEAVSRDSYELLSDSDSIFVSPDRNLVPRKEEVVPYLLHRRLQTGLASSKSCETVIRSAEYEPASTLLITNDEDAVVHRSRSFRCLREKAYREKPALFARTRLVEIDLDVQQGSSLFRPKSIEFVSFQDLPPPDAFSSQDDTVGPVDVNECVPPPPCTLSPTAIEPPPFPPVVDVDRQGRLCIEADEDEEERMCSIMSPEEEVLTAASSMSSADRPVEDEDHASAPEEVEEDEALTADDIRDVEDFVYQPDTLSSHTSLLDEEDEHLVSEELKLFAQYVNDDDGLPEPERAGSPLEDVLEDVDEPVLPDYDDYIFQAHVLSRISERSSCDSKLSFERDDSEGQGERARDNTMSDVSSSIKGSDPLADPPLPPPPPESFSPCQPPPPPPPIPHFDETTPVNESVPFDSLPYQVYIPSSNSVAEERFPSPPSSIDNLPDEESYSDSSS